MSELGSLSQCMVDCDPEGLGRARSLRRKAFAISSACEIGLLAAMILWPLITPGVLSLREAITPVAPFRGLPQNQPEPQRASQAPTDQRPRFPIFATVLRAPRRMSSQTQDAEPPGDLGLSIANSDNLVSVFPGGSDRGPAVSSPERPSAGPAGPMHVSSGVMEAALIHRAEPVYPRIAIAMHLEGTVNLQAIIRTDGSIGELIVVSGNPILAPAAVAAVREWRYKPTLLNGQPVEVETIITVNFVLEQR